MTSNELLIKLNDAKEREEKRLNTINKLCKKLNINYDNLLKEFHSVVDNSELNYLKSLTAKQIVLSFIIPTEDNDSVVYQLADNLPKLFDLMKIRLNWQAKYDTQFNKENGEKIEVLWNFLTKWEQNAIEWTLQQCDKYTVAVSNYESELQKYLNSERYKAELERLMNSSYYRIIDRASYKLEKDFKESYYSQYTALVKDSVHFKYSYKDGYICDTISYSIDVDKIKKAIAEEKLNKYFDLCNRISGIVGEIQDCKHLSIADNGDLNGYVVGSKGNAKVETIGAGGYNVGQIVNVKCGQCFHFRVLIHKF